MQTRAHHRTGTWLALFATALYALWPLLATAQPRTQGTQYELCPHTWLHKFSEETHREKPSSNPIWGDHQLQCAFSPGTGEGASPLAGTIPTALLIVDWQHRPVATPTPIPRAANRFFTAAPRGPPVLS